MRRWIDTQHPTGMMYPQTIAAQAHCPRLQQVGQEAEMTTATAPTTLDRHWPVEGVTRVPFWAYSDPQVYAQEMTRIFCGESWAYVGLHGFLIKILPALATPQTC